jgi:lipid II:glycine glycyltransferase (peptidoglycan interpeptide bridge formation enzyme)
MGVTTVKILENVDVVAYDALAAHPMQSYAWGEVRTATGIRVVRVGEYSGDALVAVYQMTVHKLPKVSYYIGYIPRSLVPSENVVTFLREWAKKEKIVFIKWEPYVESESGDARCRALPYLRHSSHPLFTEWNLEVDLTPTTDEILKNFKKNTRYSVRHAEQAGVTVREMNDAEGFAIFSDLYFSTTNRQQYHGHTRKYHQTIWNILSAAGIAKIFVAFYNDKPRAAYEIFYWHDRAYYPYSGSSAEDRNIPATQYLMWHVIQSAKAAGKTTLDLWGSLPPEHDKKHPWAGFTLFKSGFGSRYVHMSASYDLVVMPVLYRLYSVAYKLRSLIWKGGMM